MDTGVFSLLAELRCAPGLHGAACSARGGGSCDEGRSGVFSAWLC